MEDDKKTKVRSIRWPKDIVKRAIEQANKLGQSFNAYTQSLVEADLKRKRK